jgi:membrane-associated protein
MDGLLHFITHFGWIGVLAVIFAESGLMVGFFLPGDSLLFVAGTLVQNGIFDINIFLFIVCLVIAAALGNNTGYLIGRKFGRRLFNKPNSRLFKQQYLREAESFYTKQGSKTIMLAMFIPIVRAFAPVVAGIAEMNYRTFALFNLIGATIWASSMVLLGYFAGHIIEKLGINIELTVLAIILISLLPAIIHVLGDKDKRTRLLTTLRIRRRR